MLTRDLIRASVRGKTIRPSFIDPSRPPLRQAAEDLVEIWSSALQERWRRGELDEAIKHWIGARRDHKILKGLAKIMSDHSDFAVRSPLPPAELRARVFRAAREAGPLALEPGPLSRPTAEAVLEQVAGELDCTPEDVREALYADLREQERICDCRAGDAGWLLHRYNVALVQALLLHATELRLSLHAPSQPRLRQLFRLAKFHQLMVEAQRTDAGIDITFDGPASMLKQSTRYGLELASFFPAILLQDGSWSLDATVLWTRAKHRKELQIDHECGLISHRADTGAYETREQAAFRERFNARESPWRLDPGDAPVVLGDRAVIVPDFRLTHRDGRVAWLEIIGFWRPQPLKERLDRLDRYGRGDVIVAVSRSRRTSKGKEVPAFGGHLIPFAEVVPVAKVLKSAEAVARLPDSQASSS